MSHIEYRETIFALESSEMKQVFCTVHEIFLSNGFHVQLPSNIWLEDIDEGDDNSQEFEAMCIDITSQADLNTALDKLKIHKTGGCLSYYAKDQSSGPTIELVCFGSFDNKSIQYVLISIRESHFNKYAPRFNLLCNEMLQKLKVYGATRRVDADRTVYNASDVAKHILKGTFNNTFPNLELVNEFK